MGLFQPLKPKKGSLFDQRNQQLDDLYNYQNNGQNPNQAAKDQFPNLNKDKKKEKKRGLFG